MGKIIWLASYPKSGNTWLRAFLHNLLSQADRDDDRGYDINRITDLSIGDSTLDLFQPFLKKPWNNWTIEEITAVRGAVQQAICQRQDGNVFVKTHNALIDYGGRPLIYPETTAGAIYVVRNPLDVCISLSHHFSASLDWAIETMNNDRLGIATNETNVHQVYRSWSTHVASWTRASGPRLLVLRYEDLLQNTTQAFGKIAKFLAIPHTPNTLATAIDHASFGKLRAQEEQAGFNERPASAARFFRVGKAGQWREQLSQAQIDSIVAIHRDQMLRFGYWPLK